jgi:hypothetical protein
MLGCIFGTCGILHFNVKWMWLSLQYLPYSLHRSAVLLQQSIAVSCPGLFPLNAYATALGWGNVLHSRTELRYLPRRSVLAFMLLLESVGLCCTCVVVCTVQQRGACIALCGLQPRRWCAACFDASAQQSCISSGTVACCAGLKFAFVWW